MSMRVNITQKAYPVAKKLTEQGTFRMAATNHPVVSSNVDTKINLILNGDIKNAILEMEPRVFQSANSIRDAVMRAVRQFKDNYNLSFDDITAFIMGGRDFRHAMQGNDLANSIADVLEEAYIPFSMLCGKRPAVEMDNVYSVNKNTTLWNDSFKDIHKKVSVKEAIEELKHMYEIVEISDDVPFSFETPRWIND